jgi:hypothetical protein
MNPDERDWYVAGRAEKEKLILVECQLTGRLGSVKNFTPEQWDRAEYASRGSYRWHTHPREVMVAGQKVIIHPAEVLELTASVA